MAKRLNITIIVIMNIINKLKLSIRQRLIFLTAFAILSLLIALIISLLLFNQFDNRIGNIYDQRVVPLKILKTIADDYTNNIIGTINKARSDLYGPEEALPLFIQARSRIKKNWHEYTSHKLTDTEKKITIETEKLFKDAKLYLDLINTTLKKMGEDNDGQLDQFDAPLYTVIEPIQEKITELVNFQLKIAQQERDLANQQSQLIWFWFSLSGLLVIVTLCLLAYFITASITRPINNMRKIISEIEKNSDLSLRIENNNNDEIGITVSALNSMLNKFNTIIKHVETTCSGISSMINQIIGVTEKTNSGHSVFYHLASLVVHSSVFSSECA